MKARIPLTGKAKRDALTEVKAMALQEREAQKMQMSRRFFKLAAVALHSQFGFGKQRIDRFFEEVEKLILTAQDDEIFWEHIDQEVIDCLGYDFERDYTR